MGTENPIEDIVRITVRGIPLSVDDTCIKDMLEKLSTILTSDINKEKIRNPNTFKMINIELKSYIYIYIWDQWKMANIHQKAANAQRS